MNPYLVLIKYFIDNPDTYKKYISSLSLEGETRSVQTIYKELDSYLISNRVNCSLDDFEMHFINNNFENLKRDERETYGDLFNSIRKVTPSETALSTFLRRAWIRSRMLQIGETTFQYDGESTGIIGRLEELVGELKRCGEGEETGNLSEALPIDCVEEELEELYNNTVKTPGLRWRLRSLNQSLGSLRKGDFGFIFARPETGKTTFLASEITNFAKQIEAPILWFNNEEQGKKVKIRCYQAMLGLTLHQLMADRDDNQRRFRELGGSNIKIFDSATINRGAVEEICKRLNPGLIVFDQIDKLKGFDGDREDLRLGSIYQWSRELAKLWCPVIGVSQANGAAEGTKWLTMDHVAGSYTSKQAEADFILGIGKTHDPNLEQVRHFNICKNKLQGDEDSVPEMRHARIDVLILPEVAQYREIVE